MTDAHDRGRPDYQKTISTLGSHRTREMFWKTNLYALQGGHPCLGPIVDFSDHGRLGVVISEVPAPDPKPVPAPLRLRCCIDLLDLIAHLHGHGIVHGAISRGSISLVDGRPRLQPPFTTRVFERLDLAGGHNLKDMVWYQSPDGVAWCERSDQFSLGLVLYRLLYDAYPLTGPAVVWGRAPQVTWKRDRATGPLDAVLMRMISLHPEERFPSVHQAKAAFESADPSFSRAV